MSTDMERGLSVVGECSNSFNTNTVETTRADNAVDQGEDMSSDPMESSAEEEFFNQLHLSKCIGNKKDAAFPVKSPLVNRPYTRYTKYVSKSSYKSISKYSDTQQEDVQDTSTNRKRKKKLTLTEKIANLKQTSVAEKASTPKKMRMELHKNEDESSRRREEPDPPFKQTEKDQSTGAKDDTAGFSCDVCNFSTFFKAKLEEHKEDNSHILKLQIERGTDHSYLKEEKLKFENLQLPTRCETCSLEFTEREKFIRHSRSHSKTAPYKCVECQLSFFHRNNLLSHLKRHLGVRNIKCQYCDMSFDKTRNLETHLMTKHDEKDTRPRNFKCTECGDAFLSKSAVNRHMRWHTGFRPHNCEFCGQSFHTKYDLLQHQRVHSGEKPFECKTCSYKARTAQLLKRHSQTHTGEKPYSCKHCEFTCKNSSHLKRHMNVHAGRKPFKCPYCGHRCSNIENLRKHIKKVKKHQGLKIYPCSHCTSFGTDNGHEYLIHMKQYHFPYLDLKAATATKLSGIQVDETMVEESETEEEMTDVTRDNIFETETRELQDSLTLDTMQPSLSSQANILPELGLRTTMDTLNESDLHCLDSHAADNSNCESTRLDRGDIFLSSMAPFDSRDPCKASAFTSTVLFDEETCGIQPYTNTADIRTTSANEPITNPTQSNQYKYEDTLRLIPDACPTSTGLEVGSLNQGFLSVLVLQKVVIPQTEEIIPLTLVVNSSTMDQAESRMDQKIMAEDTLEQTNKVVNGGGASESVTHTNTAENLGATYVVTPCGHLQLTNVQSESAFYHPPLKIASPSELTVSSTESTSMTESPISASKMVSLGTFMTTSSINVSAMPPKILTISPEKVTGTSVTALPTNDYQSKSGSFEDKNDTLLE